MKNSEDFIFAMDFIFALCLLQFIIDIVFWCWLVTL